MQLAWSLDRQVPEWFGEVNERLRAPLNAILATLGLTALFLFFQSYKALPTIFATTEHKLNLAGTAWFSIMMAALTWTLPGINAILVRFRRPDLVRNAPYSRALPWIGLAWLVFLDAALFYLLGIIIFFIMRYRARAAGVDEKMLFTELPPD